MLVPHISDDSSLECPAGYQYYTCATSSFEGCCSIDPCELPGACPIQNQPGFQTSPDPVTSQSLSRSETTTAVVPETVTLEPAVATPSYTTFPAQSPPYSTSSAPNATAHPKLNHASLIAGLAVGLSAALIITAVMLWKLRRHRQIGKARDGVAPLLLRRLRRARAAEGSAPPGSLPDRNKPVPPVPTSTTVAGLLDQDGGDDDDDGDGQRGPTGPNTPTSTAGAPTLRQPSIRAVQFSASRVGAASISSRKNGDGGGGAGVILTPRRAPSPGDSFFDSSPGQRGSELGTTWVDSGTEYAELRSPSEFHGLSAPPRSRDGSRPGSKGTQAG